MMPWGGTWHVNLKVGREIVAMGRMARIWEEDDSLLSMTSTPGRLTPSSSTAAALGPACACGENSKPGHKLRRKSECRSHDGSMLSPTVMAVLFIAGWTFCWGPAWD